MVKRLFFSLACVVALCAPYTTYAAPSIACLSSGGLLGWEAGIDCAEDTSDLEDTKISKIISAVMKWTLTLVGILAVMAFAIAGLLYLTAAGDDEQLKKAKKTAQYAIIGIVIALSGTIIITAIDAALNGRSDF